MIDEKVITSLENVTLLGLEVDSKLNFDEDISKLCSKSAGQLNALCRIGHLIGLEERKILVNSFIYANFNYCPLVWHFSSRHFINKIENIQKRALRFLVNDCSSDYETFLKKANKCTVEVKRLRLLSIKTVQLLLRTIFKKMKTQFQKSTI